jgi:hypothetical protein
MFRFEQYSKYYDGINNLLVTNTCKLFCAVIICIMKKKKKDDTSNNILLVCYIYEKPVLWKYWEVNAVSLTLSTSVPKISKMTGI